MQDNPSPYMEWNGVELVRLCHKTPCKGTWDHRATHDTGCVFQWKGHRYVPTDNLVYNKNWKVDNLFLIFNFLAAETQVDVDIGLIIKHSYNLVVILQTNNAYMLRLFAV